MFINLRVVPPETLPLYGGQRWGVPRSIGKQTGFPHRVLPTQTVFGVEHVLLSLEQSVRF